MSNARIARAVRIALLTTGAVGAGMYGTAAAAQEKLTEIIVTGSRIVRQDDVSNSPIKTLTAEQLTQHATITIETFLNTLPGVSPAGTTTSNNPGNGGQANVNLRGLGANRNLVLIDGRRAMPSQSSMVVDLNTIPQAMIETIDIVTGGASAVYGADAIAGAVNLKLRKNFEGVDLSYSHSNSTEHWDAQEYIFSLVMGGNFADGRGNGVIGFDYADREGMVKGQRAFAAQATSSTTFLPEGYFVSSSDNPINQGAIDALFGSAAYGSHAAGSTNQTLFGFNLDGTIFSTGIFNSPLNVLNFRYPVDLSVNTNTGFFPSLYSYNFDSVNILTLPMERRSFMGKLNYEFEKAEVFGQVGWTEYRSATALAPTPFPTVRTRAPGENSSIQAFSPFVAPGQQVINALVVPLSNPFIPQDFRNLLATRTGDDPRLVGSGANEAFLMRQRTLDVGLRQANYENTVVQFMIGARGDLPGDWRWEISASEGFTEIDNKQEGNLDTQRIYNLINAADGGASICAGGFNIFGRQPVSAACRAYLGVSANLTTEFKQDIIQAFVTGDVTQLPAGPLSAVVGVEGRWFEYNFDPGAVSGAISGFNNQSPSKGQNEFKDIFVEGLVPILQDAAFAQTLSMNVGFRRSTAQFEDQIKNISPPSKSSNAYFANFNWQVNDMLRFRGGFQRAVRAPNFGELFDGGSSAPQYFDPCNRNSAKRTGPDAAAMRALCIASGIGAGAVDNFVAPPGGQLQVIVAGNTNLDAEEADSYTFGVIFLSPWSGVFENLRASLDYNRIEINNPILTPSVNTIIADCYNYYGNNPTYDNTKASCPRLTRSGGALAAVSGPSVPGVPAGQYPGVNGGVVRGEGLDLNVDYRVDLPVGSLALNLLATHTLTSELQELSNLPVLDYKGSVAYFGSGLGTSNPENRLHLTAIYKIGDFSFDARARWIDGMVNRAEVQFPGEGASLTGVPSVTYLDLGATWRPSFMGDWTLRVGVNNVSDKQPPGYAPNVQSGTESSLYDVVGRRVFGQVSVKF